MKNVTPRLKITSVDVLDATVGDLVRRRIELTQARAQMEAEMAAVEKLHAPRIQAQVDMCAWIESSVAEYLDSHREVLGERKSRETPLCVFGFRLSTSVQPATKRMKWAEVTNRMMQAGAEKYLRYKDPAVNKQALLEDREILSAQECDKLGIRFETVDEFYLTPKPDTAQAD